MPPKRPAVYRQDGKKRSRVRAPPSYKSIAVIVRHFVTWNSRDPLTLFKTPPSTSDDTLFNENYTMLMAHVDGESADWEGRSLRLMSMFECVFVLCPLTSFSHVFAAMNARTSNNSEQYATLLSQFNSMLHQYIDTRVTPVLKVLPLSVTLTSIKDKEAEDMLRAIRERWDKYYTLLRCLSFVYRSIGKDLITVGCRVFAANILLHRHKDITQVLIDMIYRARSRLDVDGALAKDVFRIMERLDSFDVHKPAIEQATATHYRIESAKWLSDCPTFLAAVTAALELEQRTVLSWLPSSAVANVTKVFDKECLTTHEHTVIELGLRRLFKDDRRALLTQMYTLFGRVGTCEAMKQVMSNHIEQECNDVFNNASLSNSQYVQHIISIHTKCKGVVDECFDSSKLFANTVQSVLRTVLNARDRPSFAERLARHVDTVLRKGSKIEERERERVLEQSSDLLLLLSSTDVFKEFHRLALAKRLVLDKCVSSDSEQFFISLLKQLFGPIFTRNMEVMLDDVLHNDITSQFREYCKNNGVFSGTELSVRVLTHGTWPSSLFSGADIVNTPFLPYQDSFKSFYISKYGNRTLTWLPQWCTCLVVGRYSDGVYDFVVSSDQACMLLMLNDGCVTVGQVCGATGHTVETIMTVLTPLIHAKIITCVKPISMESSITSSSFTHKLRRVRLNAFQAREKKGESKAVEKRVWAERDMQIDAAIVRTMKARQTMSHTDLLISVFEQVRVSLTNTNVKKRIEQMIDRDYIKRDKGDRYTYVA